MPCRACKFTKNPVLAKSLGYIAIRNVEGTANDAVPLALASFAQVDQDHFAIVEQPPRLRYV